MPTKPIDSSMYYFKALALDRTSGLFYYDIAGVYLLQQTQLNFYEYFERRWKKVRIWRWVNNDADLKGMMADKTVIK